FDIGNTLAVPVLSPSGGLVRLRVLPFVPDILMKLKQAQHRLGMISNTGTETIQHMKAVLVDCRLLHFFDPVLCLFSCVEGLDKTKKAFFELAAQRAGVASSRCVYVCEDQAERNTARSAGFEISFHPLHVFHVLGELG